MRCPQSPAAPIILALNPTWFNTPVSYSLVPQQQTRLTPSSITLVNGASDACTVVNALPYSTSETASMSVTYTSTASFSRQNTFESGLSEEVSFEVGVDEDKVSGKVGASMTWSDSNSTTQTTSFSSTAALEAPMNLAPQTCAVAYTQVGRRRGREAGTPPRPASCPAQAGARV